MALPLTAECDTVCCMADHFLFLFILKCKINKNRIPQHPVLFTASIIPPAVFDILCKQVARKGLVVQRRYLGTFRPSIA